MTPWEMAYHFPSKFKEYVMANFPGGKMPAAGRAAQEGASPPTVTPPTIPLDLPPGFVAYGSLLTDDPKFLGAIGTILEVSDDTQSIKNIWIEVEIETEGYPLPNPSGPFKIVAVNMDESAEWATAWAATPQAAAWVVEAFAWQIAKKGKPQSQ